MKTNLFAAFCCVLLFAACKCGPSREEIKKSISALYTCNVECDKEYDAAVDAYMACQAAHPPHLEHCDHVAPSFRQQCVNQALQASLQACAEKRQAVIAARQRHCRKVCYDKILTTLDP